MTTYMDYTISLKPIRIIDRKVDRSLLDIPSLSIVNAGYLPSRTLYRRQAKFAYWAIVYIAGGSGSLQVNGGDVQRVTEGSLFFFYPGATFDFGPDPGGTWDEYYFTIEGTRIEEWLSSWLREPGKVRQAGVSELYLHRMERIFQLMDSGAAVDLDRAALLLESTLFEWVQAAKTRQTARAGVAEKLLDELAQSVYSRFDAAQWCDRYHISMSTLRRLVRKASGYPLHEYVHRLKIAEAKNRLLNTDDTVKEIADKLGYADVFYFSRLFKKYAGISPREYRRSM